MTENRRVQRDINPSRQRQEIAKKIKRELFITGSVRAVYFLLAMAATGAFAALQIWLLTLRPQANLSPFIYILLCGDVIVYLVIRWVHRIPVEIIDKRKELNRCKNPNDIASFAFSFEPKLDEDKPLIIRIDCYMTEEELHDSKRNTVESMLGAELDQYFYIQDGPDDLIDLQKFVEIVLDRIAVTMHLDYLQATVRSCQLKYSPLVVSKATGDTPQPRRGFIGSAPNE